MDGNFFFVIGIVLVAAAVVLAFFGIRGAGSFPPSRGAMVGVIALFLAIVATTMAFAVVKSVDEQDKRNKELAQEEHAAGGTTTTPAGQPQGGGAVQTLDVSSPADGGLVFEPNGLTAQPGNVDITYDNPLPGPAQHRDRDGQRQRARRGAAVHGRQAVGRPDQPRCRQVRLLLHRPRPPRGGMQGGSDRPGRSNALAAAGSGRSRLVYK